MKARGLIYKETPLQLKGRKAEKQVSYEGSRALEKIRFSALTGLLCQD